MEVEDKKITYQRQEDKKISHEMLLTYDIFELAKILNISEDEKMVDIGILEQLEKIYWDLFHKGYTDMINNIDYIYHIYYPKCIRMVKLNEINSVYRLLISKGRYEELDNLVCNLINLKMYDEAIYYARCGIEKTSDSTGYLKGIINRYEQKCNIDHTMDMIKKMKI